jgi:hypothetical protein
MSHLFDYPRAVVRQVMLRSLPTATWLLDIRSRKLRQRTFSLLGQSPWRELPQLSPEQLARRLPPRTNMCHIIGSGWSLLDGIDRIGPNDVVFGCNKAIFAPLRFDLYLIERAMARPMKGAVASDVIADALLRCAPGRAGIIGIKNIWMGRVDPEYVQATFGERAYLIPDYHMYWEDVAGSEPLRVATARRLVAPDPALFANFATSTITMIGIAARLGFNEIMVHGLDGGGPYFFELPGFTPPNDVASLVASIPTRPDVTVPHDAAARGLLVLAELRDVLASRGVSLLCASARSPSATILPLFNGPRSNERT